MELAAHPLAGGRPPDDVITVPRAAGVASRPGAAGNPAAPTDRAQRGAGDGGHC